MENKHEVKLSEKLGFLGFSTSTNIVFNFKSLYYLAFLTMILGIPEGIAATMLGIGTIWDAINDPLIALFCTNHKFKNGERVRPYALYACVPWAITVVLMFVNFNLTQNWMVIIGLIIYFAYEALYTFVCMPYNSMAALSTKNDAERKSINGFRSLGGCFGSAIGALAILPLVRLFGGLTDHKILNEGDAKPLFYTAICMGVLCIAGSLFHYFTSKERVKPEEGDKEDKITLIQAYKMLFKCKSWVYNMFYILGYGITTAIVMNNIQYYAGYILGDSNKSLPIQAAYLVAAVALSILTPTLDKKLGRRKTMLLGLAIMVLGKIPFIIAPTNMVAIIINALTVGIGATITFVLFNTNRNNITDLVEIQNGRRIDTLISGGDNLIAKLGEAFSVMAMGWIYEFTGMDKELANHQTLATNEAIFAFLGWVPLIICLVMAYFAFKIDIPKEMEEAKAKRAQNKGEF